MKLSVEMTDEQQRRLSEEARRLNVAVEELVGAAVRDLLAGPEGDFRQAAKRVLEKNRELYRRLS
ncbi:MAG: DNA-binding protein [candidate division NC10 bacterium]|nr:DNA-binding protein [candidate division NC10 bacterium]